MATKTLADVYDQYLGRAPDAAGAQYWNQQLASGSSLADVERAIAASSEASKLATAPRSSNIINTPTFSEAQRGVQFAEPMKVTAAAVSNILKDQQGGKAVGEWVPERVLSNGQIKYKFVGDLGTPKLADVYGLYASLPDTVTSWGELSDQVKYLQANPQQQLTALPTSREKAYYGSLALAMDEAGGNLSREQMQQIANDLYAREANKASENYGKPVIGTPIYLRPGMSAAEQYNAFLGQTTQAPQQLQQTGSPQQVSIQPGGTQTLPSVNVQPGSTQYLQAPSFFQPNQGPVNLFQQAMAQTMPTAQQQFQMPSMPIATNWSNPNVPTQNPFAPRPAMFAEGGEVGNSDWQDWMSQSMAGQIPGYTPFTTSTYQYPAYGGMPQDVFDWTAPRVSGGKLIQPPRQAPAQFTAPLLTAPVPSGGISIGIPQTGGTTSGGRTPSTSSGGIFAPTPVAPPNTGGITTLPVDNTAEQARLAEEARLAEQARLAEATRIAEQNRLAEEARLAQQARSTGIQQYYRDILNREADVPGLDYWTKSGETLDQVRSNIALNERNAVEQYYRDILGREADPEGLKYWTESKDTLEQIRGNMQLIKEREAAAAAQTAAVTQAVAQAQAPRGYVNPEGESGTSWYAGDSGD
jgi:hypothetical protein